MMIRTFLVSVLAASVLMSVPAYAQTDMGGLRGYAKDEQGAVLPGVTVTVTGPAILAPVVAVTDTSGYYRILNLPPGALVLTADIQGFAPYRQDGIVIRAGSTFAVDIDMKLASVAETVTVHGESPMIETLKATTSYAISGELFRAAPVTARSVFTDTLDVLPAIGSGQANDGSGVRIYYFMGSSQWGGFTALDGAPFTSFGNFAPARSSMSTETVGDVEVRAGGAEAFTPLTTGIYMNIVSPRGGNTLKGGASVTYMPLKWNADNSSGGRIPGGFPKAESIRHLDLSLGGPIKPNKVWFFSSYRYASDENGISRAASDLKSLQTFRPDFKPFNNPWSTTDPYVKVTSQLTERHELSAFYHYDRMQYTSHQNNDADPIVFQSGGGSVYSARVNSVWGNHLVSQLTVSYNNKSQSLEDTYNDLKGSGPQILIHNDAFTSSGIQSGTGALVRENNAQTINLQPASFVLVRADLTFFRDRWAGSHEFKTGFFGAPRSNRDQIYRAVNDGFLLEEDRQIDPNNPAAGLIWFHRQTVSPATIRNIGVRDRDYGIYVQDTWKPIERVSINAGVRADSIRRWDDVLGFQRMNTTVIGPRFGLTYLVTKDAKNVVRFFAGRTHEQMAGNDVVDTFAGVTPLTTTDVYRDKAGSLTTVITPPTTTALAPLQVAKDISQPFIDEYILGFRKQFKGQLSIDVTGQRRSYKNMYGLVDINGIYPSAPFQPFGGFGLIDPNRGIIQQERNNTWSQSVVTALSAVVAKNMSKNFQLMVSANHQWQHLAGTWNPTEPARFIQPDAFADNRDLPGINGNGDTNTINGGWVPGGYSWRPYNIRMIGQYLAPHGITLSSNYQYEGGDYSGPIVTRLSAADPRFGPSTVTLANGTTQPNPLATTIRFAYANRGEGQVLNEPIRTLQVRIGKVFKFKRNDFESAFSVYNVLNSGANIQYKSPGGNQMYSPNFLQAFNKLPARGFQLQFVDKF
jgi:carboxypeptidase family protein